MKCECWVIVDENGHISPPLFKRCLRCGKILKAQEAQERGYGKKCWEKRHTDNQKTLF